MDCELSASATSSESISDSECVRKFKHGQEQYFDELVKRYQAKIYALALRMVHNQEDAWELSQETFVRAYHALPKFKEKSSFYTWLFRIGFNLCLSFLKKHRHEKNVSSLDDMTEETLLLEPISTKTELTQPDIMRKRQIIAQTIAKAVGQLPAQQKLIFMMRQYDGLDNAEIAELLQLSIGAVKSHYHHAVKKLQISLKAIWEK